MGSRRAPLSGARRVVVCGLLAGLLTASKAVMSPLPNIEPVSLLLMVYAAVLGREALYTAVTFVLLEGLIYGFGLWWFGYPYIWPVWALAAARLSPQLPAPVLAAACGGFGLSFGLLESLPYLAGGPWAAVSHWTAGIPFDLAHCGGNFLLALFLAKPLLRLLQRLTGRALPR